MCVLALRDDVVVSSLIDRRCAGVVDHRVVVAEGTDGVGAVDSDVICATEGVKPATVAGDGVRVVVAVQPEIAVVAVDRVLRTAINHCEVWYDAAIQMHEANEQFIADRADREKAEADAAQKALTSTPVLLREAMAQANASSVPGLNSAAILRAALAGGSGSINGAVIQGSNE